MIYSISELAKLAGISTRTLRYYHQIGLLLPADYTEKGYRLYRQNEVNQLQHILFLRALQVPLATIQKIIKQPELDEVALLQNHRQQLLLQKEHVEQLLATVDATIAEKTGGKIMKDVDKFAAFKERLVRENEEKYGKESRLKYGDDQVDQLHQNILALSESEYQACQTTEERLLSALAGEQLAIPSAEAEEVFALHQAWLQYYWVNYQVAAHAGLAEMYAVSPEFQTYYDTRAGDGATDQLVAILRYYTQH